MALGTTNPYPRSIGSFQVPVAPPEVDPDAEPLVTVCFSADWLSYVVGALQQLTLQATWLGDESDVQLASDRAQLLIAMFGSSSGGCVNGLCITGVVYDPDCDCIMWTPAPGVDPVENPALDPRHADGFRFPPNTAEDQQCQAAANMTRFISDLIAETILVVDTAGTAEGVVAILLPFLVELGPFGILIDLVLGLAFILFSAGAAAISAAFTSDVYDQLTCIFFCNIESDGTVTADELTQITADISMQIGGLVSTVLAAMFFLMGEVGLSNAGAVGEAPADCDECACAWCYTWLDGAGFDPPWSLDFGSYDSGADELLGTNTTPSTGNTVLLQAKIHFDSSTITYFSVQGLFKSGDTFGGNSFAIGNGTTYGTNIFSQVNPAPTNTEDTLFLGGDSTPGDLTDLWIQIGVPSADTLDTYLRIQQITIRGTGVNPFGADNCT